MPVSLAWRCCSCWSSFSCKNTREQAPRRCRPSVSLTPTPVRVELSSNTKQANSIYDSVQACNPIRGWRVEVLARSLTCWLMTSRRVAGVLETYWTQSCPSSVHSRGGRIEFKMSSVCVRPGFCSTGGSSFLPLCKHKDDTTVNCHLVSRKMKANASEGRKLKAACT